MLTENELKNYIQNNEHLRNYPITLLEREGLFTRDRIFEAQFKMKTTDKRTKEYNELQKTIAWNRALAPQIKEAYKTITGNDFPHHIDY